MKHEGQLARLFVERLSGTLVVMERLVRWFWNQRFGRLARHDVKIFEYDGRWRTEAWQGGVEGKHRVFELPDEAACIAQANELMLTMGPWQEMKATRQR